VPPERVILEKFAMVPETVVTIIEGEPVNPFAVVADEALPIKGPLNTEAFIIPPVVIPLGVITVVPPEKVIFLLALTFNPCVTSTAPSSFLLVRKSTLSLLTGTFINVFNIIYYQILKINKAKHVIQCDKVPLL
jgi:hypothetical protein